LFHLNYDCVLIFLVSPAEKRALKQKERDIAQGKQDEEELRLSLFQVPQEVFY
jgi:hypothetical protein